MPNISDPQPQNIINDLAGLNLALNAEIPLKHPSNLLIATWNLRMFGDLTEKWKAASSDSPKRDLHCLLCIIEIIKRFDIIALQEVKDNIKCLRDTMRMLGPDWSFVMTDVTEGDKGNGERLAYLFDTRKVSISGIACEIVVPEEQLVNDIEPDALRRQFARTPYAVSFKANGKTFILLTLHVLFGNNAAERVPELKAIAKWMYKWSKQLNSWGQSLITLGDFNIDRKDDIAYNAFVSTGLHVPDDLQGINRTIFGNTTFYDQIAWFRNSANHPQINLDYVRGGLFNFKDKLLREHNYSNSSLSFRISDHLPLWAEFVL